LDPIAVTIPNCNNICEGTPQNLVCTTVYEPVCGCNGQTYMNACTASAAGIQSIVSGPCAADQCNATEDLVKNGDFEEAIGHSSAPTEAVATAAIIRIVFVIMRATSAMLGRLQQAMVNS
ncbi:MAG: Kazal-type serine protease inhibitor, partial [Bacteroidota bacterium]